MTQFVEIAEAGQKTTQEMQQIIDKFNQELLGSNSDIETALKQYQPEALILLKSEMSIIAERAQQQIGGLQITQKGKTYELI